MNSVAIYLRKSRDEENESRDVTLARHEKLLLEYCERNNLHVKKIYKEVVSGESIAARLEMQRLLLDISAGKYDGVVCIEIERLSRGNQVDQAEILEVFKKTHTKIYTLNKIYDFSTDNEIDEEFFEFGLFMSRREYKVICRRLARGRSAALLEGYYTGSVLPYGFTKEKKGKGFVLIPYDPEADIVRLIFDKFINGAGVPYLRCVSLKCETKSTKLEKVETQIIDELTEELKNFKYYIDNQAEEDNRKSQRINKEIKVIEQAIKKKDKALDTCCELLEDGVYTRDQYFKRVNVLTEERDALQANLEALRDISDDNSESIRSAVPILSRCIEKYPELDIQAKNKTLKSIIDKIDYSKTSKGSFDLKIYLKF